MLRYDNNIRNNFRWATFIHHSHLKLGFAAVFSVLLNESLLTDVDSVNLVHEVVPEITVHLIEVVIRFASLQTLKNIKIKGTTYQSNLEAHLRILFTFFE